MTSRTANRGRFWRLILGVTAGLGLAAAAYGQAADADGDGVADAGDNCTQVANPDQQDADGDKFGNMCDGDLDNNGITDDADFELLRSVLNQEALASALAAAAHMDGNGRVTAQDFGRLRSTVNAPPGPSGLVP